MSADVSDGLRLAPTLGGAAWRLVLKDNPQPAWVFSPETLEIFTANAAAAAHYGYTPEEFTRLTVAELCVPEDAAECVRDAERAPAEARTLGRYRHRLKSGTVAHVEVVTHELPTVGPRARLAIVSDVSERVALQAQLRQAQKMGAVGQLATSIAHDFNNLLTAIIASVELAETVLEPGHLARPDLEMIERASRRAADLTRQLLTLSRKRPPTPQVLDLNAVIAGPVQLLRRLIGLGVELRLLPSPNLWVVQADSGQMEQVLLNLVVNARDAMPNGGVLTVSTANRAIEVPPPHQPGLVPGEYVALAVRDTGVGMDAATIGRVFEPFFTTKPANQGTGLGLSTVYGIVKQWGGYVYAESAPNEGTTVTALLPRMTE